MSSKTDMVSILAFPRRPMCQPRLSLTILRKVNARASWNTFQHQTFSFLLDRSTDAGNVEYEIVLIQYGVQDAVARCLPLKVPIKADANGLIKCLGHTVQVLGIDNILDTSYVVDN